MVEFLQLYYTSCKKGLSRGRGAQTYSMSEGLTPLERQEIEDYGLYLPPADLPSEPSEDQIADLFPVALTFFTLKSGRVGVSQSKYTGRDFSGRWGNYFCHALVVKEGTFPCYPIELYGSSVFRDRLLPEEENIKGQPAPLPVLSGDDLVLDGSVTRERVSDFIANNPEGAASRDMLTAILGQGSSRRRLVLCDAWQRIPYWIGLMQMAFNLEASHHLSFTTYTIDPQKTDCLVSATSRTGSRFSFSELERDHQYYLFNFTDHDYSRIEAGSRFGAAVNETFRGGAAAWDVLQEFKTLFRFRDIGPEYDAAWSLFQIIRNGFNGLDQESILAAVKLTESHELTEILARLAARMDDLIAIVPEGADADTLTTMAGLFFKIADHTGQEARIETAFGFFLSALDDLIFKRPAVDRSGILDFNDRFLLARRDQARDFVGRAASSERLNKLKERLLENPGAARAGVLLSLTVGNLISTGIDWDEASADPGFPALAGSCLEILLADREELVKTLSIAGRDVEYLARLTDLAIDLVRASAEGRALLVESFIEVLKTKPSGFTIKAREILAGLKQEEFLFQEFQTLFRSSADRSRFFWNYQSQVFAPLTGYRRDYFSRAARTYMDGSGQRPGLDECLRLMKSASDLKDDDLRQVFKYFEDSLNVDSPQASLYPSLSFAAELKAGRNIPTRPDVVGLLLFGFDLMSENGREKEFMEIQPSPFPDIGGMPSKKYQAYLDWLLPLALPRISNSRGHASLAAGLSLDWSLDDLAASYLKHMTALLAREKRPQEKLLYFISFLLSPSAPSSGDRKIKNLLTNGVPALLLRQSRSTLKEAAAAVEQGRGLDLTMWNNLLEKVDEKRDKSIKSRIMKLIRPRR